MNNYMSEVWKKKKEKKKKNERGLDHLFEAGVNWAEKHHWTCLGGLPLPREGSVFGREDVNVIGTEGNWKASSNVLMKYPDLTKEGTVWAVGTKDVNVVGTEVNWKASVSYTHLTLPTSIVV